VTAVTTNVTTSTSGMTAATRVEVPKFEALAAIGFNATWQPRIVTTICSHERCENEDGRVITPTGFLKPDMQKPPAESSRRAS